MSYELKKLRILLLLVLMTVATAVMAQESKEHTVARGETMASIAQLYGLTEEQLKAANPNASMCFAGMKLVIPDPAAAAAQGKDGDDKGDKKDDKDKKKDDDGKKKDDDGKEGGGFKKLLNSVGDALGDAAKVTGTVLSAAAYTKLHGGSTYDVVANSIEAVSNKKEGKKNDFTIRGRKMSERKRSFSKDSDDDGNDDADSSSDSDSGDDKKDKKGKKGGTADKAKTKQKDAKAEDEPDPEIEELYQSYVTKYNQAVTELEQLKSVYDKANNTAKIRTWNNVSESANAFRQQMEKYRQDCEKFTGRLIDSAAIESWRPVSPRK